MKTVTVKIAAAVDPKGNWNSCGWHGGDDEEVMDLALNGLDEGEARYWLTATLVVPEALVIAASVAPAE